MKIALLTNMPSPHQIELGQAFAKLLGDNNFRLVFHGPTSQARREMGWSDSFQESYIVRYWESDAARQEVVDWVESADVVIQGRFPIQYLRARIRAGRLTFAYQERYWKRTFSYLRMLTRLPRLVRLYWSVNRPNYHLLAAGAYVATDLNRLGIFRNRSWRFGYFIQPSSRPRKVSSEKLTILWCARFSKVKQAHHAVRIAAGLQKRKVDFSLTMVGDGECREDVQRLAKALGLASEIKFVGWQSSQSTTQLMAEADVFLMTSDFGEGWGVVVNEAMASGCAVVANRAVGSAPWLIGESGGGLLYSNDELETVADKIAGVPHAEWRKMGQMAYDHHREFWSADVAANRFVVLSKSLLANDGRAPDLYQSGPCSRIDL